MATVIMQRWTGFSPEQYDAVRELVGWDRHNPAGMRLHVASFNNGELDMTDVWDSEAQFMTFVETQIMPAVAQLGIKGQPETTVSTLYELTDVTSETNPSIVR
jgi:hypothetical protein